MYWAACFGACLSLVIFQVISVFDKYMSHPYTTKVTLKHHSIKFPTVTVCNVNPVRLSKYKEVDELAEFIDLLGNGTAEIDPYFAELAKSRMNNVTESNDDTTVRLKKRSVGGGQFHQFASRLNTDTFTSKLRRSKVSCLSCLFCIRVAFIIQC